MKALEICGSCGSEAMATTSSDTSYKYEAYCLSCNRFCEHVLKVIK